MTPRNRMRSPWMARICAMKSPMKLMRKRFAGSAAGTRATPSVVIRPDAASAMRMAPDQICLLPNASDSQPATIVPVMMALKVPRPKMPLPHESFFSGNSSGSSPYLDGPKIALCVLIRKIQQSSTGMLPRHRPNIASDMMPNSAHLTPTATLRLLKRSARKPPVIENRMNGNANSAPMMLTKRLRSPSGSPIAAIKKMASHLSRLSLKAFWNSTTNMSQKLRPSSLRFGAAGIVSGVRDLASGISVSIACNVTQSSAPVGIEKLSIGIGGINVLISGIM